MELLLNETAEAILERARHEARRNGAASVRSEHLMLALLAQDGLTEDLIRYGVPIERARVQIEALVANEEVNAELAAPPLSEEVETVLRQASLDAWADAHNRVGPRQLLAALVSRPWDRIAYVLARCDVDVGYLRDCLRPPRRGHSAPQPPPPETDPTGFFLAGWLEEDVLATLHRASEEAAAQGYQRVQPQHLLNALLARERGLAAQVCLGIEVSPDDLRSESSHWVASDEEGQRVYGVRVSRSVAEILAFAQEAVAKLGAPRANCSDVFSAMLASGDPFLPTLLERFHVPPCELRHERLDLAGPDCDAVLEEAASMSEDARRHARHDEELDRALARAREEAEKNASDHVGTEHLLLALVLDTRSVAARVLAATEPEDGEACRVFPPLTTRARVVLRQAARLVTGPEWPAVNRGHLLKALLPHQGGTAREVIEKLVLGRGMLVARAEEWSKASECAARPRAFTPSVWEALDAAWEEAEREGLGHVGTGHLFYGVLAVPQRRRTIFASPDPPAASVRAVLDRLLR